MINNIPTPAELYDAGHAQLNHAWESVINLCMKMRDGEWRGFGEERKEYWDAARRQLLTARTTAQQGIEFIVKAKISEISPLLLIANTPKEYPNNKTGNLDFSEFKTIDAQDLIKIHDTFAPVRLPEKFTTKFNELRKARNAIVHTLANNLHVTANDILQDILDVYEFLLPSINFLLLRRMYLERAPETILGVESVEAILIQECELLIDLLPAKTLKQHFGFIKKQRRYICPDCSYEVKNWGFEGAIAQLKPNSANSTNIWCFACSSNFKVNRETCELGDCKGNVHCERDEMCLTCGGLKNVPRD